MTRALALAALCLLATGCSRIENIGRAPDMTAPGRPDPVVAPVSPERVALATPRPPPPPPVYSVNSLWNNGPTSLFGDRRAQSLGDILTVVIEIDDSASLNNSTDRSRSGSEDLAIGAFFGLPSVADAILPQGAGIDPAAGIASSSGSQGDGSISRDEKITLRVAATVTDVFANGHMAIRGTQEVRVNYELRDLQVAGVIRPEDITRKNEITYDKIADARILYGGRGQITDVQQPRYGQQLADIIMPF